MTKENKKKVLLILLGLLFLTGWFYWFEIRPAQIKHDCSWVKVTESAVQAHLAMTEEELKDKGLIKSCPTIRPKPISGFYDEALEKRIAETLCETPNKKAIEEYSKPREAIPEKISWRKAENEEYRFCLRDNGL